MTLSFMHSILISNTVYCGRSTLATELDQLGEENGHVERSRDIIALQLRKEIWWYSKYSHLTSGANPLDFAESAWWHCKIVFCGLVLHVHSLSFSFRWSVCASII